MTVKETKKRKIPLKKEKLSNKAGVKKTLKRKIVSKKKIPHKKVKTKVSKDKIIGIVTHYFPKASAAAIKLNAPLKTGDMVKIKGHTTDFTQLVDSMQADRTAIHSAQKGQEIGLWVNSRVRRHDKVYKVTAS